MLMALGFNWFWFWIFVLKLANVSKKVKSRQFTNSQNWAVELFLGLSGWLYLIDSFFYFCAFFVNPFLLLLSAWIIIQTQFISIWIVTLRPRSLGRKLPVGFHCSPSVSEKDVSHQAPVYHHDWFQENSSATKPEQVMRDSHFSQLVHP